MSTAIMDDCLYHLYAAEKELLNYKELDSFSEIFEAEAPEVKNQLNANADTSKSVMDHLKKAAQAVLNIIKNLIDSISNFFAKRNLDAEQREAYELFKKACQEDPSLKNKKITVNDFNKVYGDYASILKEAENADKELASGKETDVSAIMNKITSFCSSAGKGVAIAVGAEAALNIASSSRQSAKRIYATLKNDQQLEEMLIDAIGKAETHKFENQVKSLGKRISLHRQVMKLKGTVSNSYQDAIENTFNSVKEVCGGAKTIYKNKDQLVKGKGKISTVVNTGKFLLDDSNRESTKNLIKNAGMAKRVLGNQDVKDVIGTGKTMKKDVKVVAKKEKKAEAKAERKHKIKQFFSPKPQIHDQSATSAALGLNDPNSIVNKALSGSGKRK